MDFGARLISAFLASFACLALAFVLGPAAMILVAIPIVVVAFSEIQFAETNKTLFAITCYGSLFLTLLLLYFFENIFNESVRQEIVKSISEYQRTLPIFADRSLFEVNAPINKRKFMFDSQAYLLSHISLFILVFLGVCQFGVVQKALHGIDSKFESDGKIILAILTLMFAAGFGYLLYNIYFEEYRSNTSGKGATFFSLSLPMTLIGFIFVFTMVRRIFK